MLSGMVSGYAGEGNWMEKREEVWNLPVNAWTMPLRLWAATVESMQTAMLYWLGLFRYSQDFLQPFFLASESFKAEESRKFGGDALENIRDYAELLGFNLILAVTAWKSSVSKVFGFHLREFQRFAFSLINTLEGADGETVDQYMAKEAKALERLVIEYPEAIRDIDKEFGFHFDEEAYELVDETERMSLYQVLPTEPEVKVRMGAKPILAAHPYVLGPNILAFLPGERKSYVHAFANQGIPTYVRIVKDIHANPAVQVMTGEDDVLDTKRFSEVIVGRHGKALTLNGVCQGGFLMAIALLSGELDGLVDAFITCGSPIDGTRSPGLKSYLDEVVPRFRRLAYATKTLPNGNRVIDGKIMSWVYKLKSIEKETPLYAYYESIDRFEEDVRHGIEGMGKTAAGINHWLIYDRTDLPVKITELSRLSYTIPISPEGDLPFTLFGRRLNLRHIAEKGIRWLICYGKDDKLVEPPSALAPLDFLEAEVTEFPKGHAAIYTTWSHPDSEYALHKRFPSGQRGPVRFQLDLDEEPADKQSLLCNLVVNPTTSRG
jgi:hypothetical protein